MSVVFTGGVGGGGVWADAVDSDSMISFVTCIVSGNTAKSGYGELCAVVCECVVANVPSLLMSALLYRRRDMRKG